MDRAFRLLSSWQGSDIVLQGQIYAALPPHRVFRGIERYRGKPATLVLRVAQIRGLA